MSSEQSVDASHQYVVYTLDESAHPSYFLDVVNSYDDAVEAMNKWWKAFDSGEKQPPRNYAGVSFQHVSKYEEWQSGDGDGEDGWKPDTDAVKELMSNE